MRAARGCHVDFFRLQRKQHSRKAGFAQSTGLAKNVLPNEAR